MSELPILDTVDMEILMHRDVHFGGNFAIMREYYENEGIGIVEDFDIERINHLEAIQEELGENLSTKILPLPALEEIERAKEAYKQLRSVYEGDTNTLACLISDLILDESENPEEIKEKIQEHGQTALEPLLHLVNSAEFYNPLFPGYGRAPLLAADCLGLIKDARAIPHLFGALGQNSFDANEAFISSLLHMKDESKEFLLLKLQKLPLGKDNEHAAIVLSSFPPDEEIAHIALSLLSSDAYSSAHNLIPYLICACEGLTNEQERIQFSRLKNISPFKEHFAEEIDFITKIWSKKPSSSIA